MSKPSPRGLQSNLGFLTYQLVNLGSHLPQLKFVCAWVDRKPGRFSAALHYSNNYREGCPGLIALNGYLLAKVMLCVLALAAVLEPRAGASLLSLVGKLCTSVENQSCFLLRCYITSELVYITLMVCFHFRGGPGKILT